MEITEIKAHLSLHTVLKHYNLTPDRNGMLRCPFHADDTASLKIYPNTNTFNCFGCGKNGDQIEFCTLKEGNKHKGILRAKELLNIAEIPISGATSGVKATELTGEIKPINEKPYRQGAALSHENHTEILTKIFESFKNGLNHPVSVKPKEYLKSRGFSLPLLGEAGWGPGYNSGQFHHRGGLSEADKQACINAGLLIPYNGSVPNASGTTYTPFAKDCIIFPLKDKSGNIVSLYGRSITNNSLSRENGNKSKHYYLKDRCGLYPGYPNPNTTKLILTEAIIDTASLLQIPAITAEYEILSCYGTNGLTEEHKAAIKQLQRLEEIIFFFDGDKAGSEAIKKYQDELSELLPGIKLTAIETPEGEDVNSLSVAYDAETDEGGSRTPLKNKQYGKQIFIHLLNERKPFLLTEINESKEHGAKSKEAPEIIGTLANCHISKLNTRNPENPESHTTTALKVNFSNEQFITYTTSDLQIIILGGINLQQLDRLRVTLKISRTDTNDPLHSVRHTLDLYHSDYLEKFINKASEQLETGTNVLKRALAELTGQIEQYRLSRIESQKEKRPQERKLSEQSQRRAIKYLGSPKLMERTNNDIGRTGMIGEENNRLLMYLVFTSRLREQPLHIISLGASGTGKTYLQEKVSELIPEHHKLEITILSENAFYYFGQQELKHKLILIEDMDGAENVLYPLRELQSKKKISKTIPIKDSRGNLKTITLKVEGPICLAGTTTKEKLYEDNANRSLLIYLDSSKQHKEHIMNYQRKLSAGKIATTEEKQMIEFFKDMQTILKPIKVRNPFAEYLIIPEHVFKPLRTNSHYLAFIETITFYHQYQREIKYDKSSSFGGVGEAFIETTPEDIEWANLLLKDILLAKVDELPGAVRDFLERLKRWLQTNGKEIFYSKEIREEFRIPSSSCNRYIMELLRNNYIKITGGNKYRQGFEYQVVKFNEYKELQQNIKTALDEALENIKKQCTGILTVSQNTNGILKTNNTKVLSAVSR